MTTNGKKWNKLLSLRSRVLRCRRCGGGLRPVPGEGYPSPIVFVGRNPGVVENRTGRPFCGPAGRVYDSELVRIGLDRSKLWTTNAAKCFFQGDRPPTPAEFNNCFPFLFAELMIIKPQVVVSLGEEATRAFLHSFTWREVRDIPHSVTLSHRGHRLSLTLFPISHPAVAVRSRGRRAVEVYRGFNNLRDYLKAHTDVYLYSSLEEEEERLNSLPERSV